MRKHIVVIDGAWAGHHPSYVKAFARVLLNAGYKVSILCPAPEEMAEWFTKNLLPEAAEFEAQYFSDRHIQLPRFFPARFKPLMICLAHWFHVSNSLSRLTSLSGKPDMVFFAWLDNYLNGQIPTWLVDWRFPFAWSGLYFHPRHHRSKQSGVDSSALPENLIAKSRFACSLAVLDAGVANKIRITLSNKSVFIFPDFSDEIPHFKNYHLIEEIIGKARHRKIIGLLGSLERRKGLLTLIRLSQQPIAQNWYFVIAGELAEQTFSDKELNEVKLFFDEPRDNIFVHLGRISDDAKFNALVNMCDVIFAMYQGFMHSSNLVTKAATYGKSLLVSSGGYMEEVVRQYELGEVVSAGDDQAALASLSKLTAEGSAPGCSVGMRAYSMEQSQEKLRKVLLDLVGSCIGNAAGSGIIDSAKSTTCR